MKKLAHTFFLLLVTMLVMVVGMTSAAIWYSRKAMMEMTDGAAIPMAQQVSRQIDMTVYERIFDWETYVLTNSELALALSQSNDQFDQMEQQDAYMAEQDVEWAAQAERGGSALAQQILDHPSSLALRSRLEVMEQQRGYPLFGEVFVTNRYGVNVAQSDVTSDYYQADEEWWQRARETGRHIGDVTFDESAGLYSIELCLRLVDEKGQFAGVLKSVLNIQEVIETAISAIDEPSETISPDFVSLATADRRVFFSTNPESFYEPTPGAQERTLVPDLESHGNGIYQSRHGSDGHEYIVARVTSKGYKSFAGLGWIVELGYHEAIAFEQINQLVWTLMLLGSGLSGLTILIGVASGVTILKPIQALTQAAKQVSEGRFEVSLIAKGTDEIAMLGQAFVTMANKLKESYQNLETTVVEKTKELSTKVAETESKNLELQRTKTAMMNLLEDARDLEVALVAEKESVEQKVSERTKELMVKTTALQTSQKKVSEGWLQLQQEKARLTASIQSMPLGFLLTDIRGTVLIANDRVGEILGERELNWTLGKLQEKLSGVDLTAYWTECITKNKEVRLSEVNTGNLFIRVLLSPIAMENDEGRGVIGAVILVEDVTEAKQLQKSRDEFFAVASHELRTPLTAIRGNSSMIKEFFAQEIKSPEFMEMIADIHAASIRLIGIVNDFLDASKLELKKLDLKPEEFDLVTLIEDVVRELNSQALAKQLGVTKLYQPGENVPMTADKERVRQILVNLIGNAIKFTQAGEVKLDYIVEHERVKVTVIDTGPGIGQEDRRKLFVKFKQLQSVYTRDVSQGTGMGLYVSSLLAEAMGGKTYLEWSEVGKGSVFVLELPLKR